MPPPASTARSWPALLPIHPPGTLLGRGSKTLSVTFTPTDTTDFKTVSIHTTLVVNAASPTINWAAPAAITFGTLLSGTQLDATASYGGKAVPGTFAYGPASGSYLNAGLNQTLIVRFTPTDSIDFKTVTASTRINVNAAPLSVTVNPSARFYGQANPTFTVSYHGLVLGQGPGALGGALAFATTAVPSSNVGGYAVQASGLASPNYAISYSPGVLAVDPAVVTFAAVNKARTVGAANPKLTYVESGLVLGQSAKKVFKGAPRSSPRPPPRRARSGSIRS